MSNNSTMERAIPAIVAELTGPFTEHDVITKVGEKFPNQTSKEIADVVEYFLYSQVHFGVLWNYKNHYEFRMRPIKLQT